MIFLTVGTVFPFDRLVRAVDSAVEKNLIEDEVFAQIGHGGFEPRNMEYVETLGKEAFDEKVRCAACVISHAGMGSIIAALSRNKPLLVMPRMKRFAEHVNDHQVDIAKKFEKYGHLLVASDVAGLPDAIAKLKDFVPRERSAAPRAVADRISRFLNGVKS